MGGEGGLPNLLQYYNRGGGVYRDPKFVLRNKWTAPKQPLASGQKSGIFVSAQCARCATWVSGKAVSVMRAKTASFQFLFAGV